ncbi:MAG: alkaline phosphatase family protein [Deltaproteobacteria bacterium]|nr:alkaline phosphatase family protein [Deltaproteobacteria bacterium]
MAKKPKKVAVIGLDCALPHMIEKHIEEGYLPTFKKLRDKGVWADNCLVPFPTVTPPNWAAIATGAFSGTTGITDFHYHSEGEELDNSHIRQNFSSERCQAEYIWDALDKEGKKCIVLNYPSSWPGKMENGILVGGTGMTIGETRANLPQLDMTFSVSADQLVTTGFYPNAIRGEFQDAEDWENVDELRDDPLEMVVPLKFNEAEIQPVDTTWYLLARENEDGDYDRVTLSPGRDFNDAFCTLKVGEWSSKIVTNIKFPDGSDHEVFFRCKLIELSDDAEDLRFLIGAMVENDGWTSPAEIAKELVSEEGCFHAAGGMVMTMLGLIDYDTYVEMNDHLSIWMADAATTLMQNHEWDLFFMHSHPIDWMYHVLISQLESPDEKVRAKAWEAHRKMYEVEDRMLARLLEAAGKDTLIVLVSDHGATPDGPTFDPYKALVPAGLSAIVEKEKSDELDLREKILSLSTSEVDIAQSKAIPQREIYIYVNLKGRDKGGIVEPEDYEKVQQEIIDALYGYVDPETGKRPIALALTKQDARLLGLHGDRVGDVVYAVQPWFGSQHGQILPTATQGVGSLKGLLCLTGPGVKKGFRLERTCNITDLVPTICYLLDFPVPENVEGAVIYQAFKDPNFKMKEIKKLKDGLARMEAALERGSREPWDHHDCA